MCFSGECGAIYPKTQLSFLLYYSRVTFCGSVYQSLQRSVRCMWTKWDTYWSETWTTDSRSSFLFFLLFKLNVLHKWKQSIKFRSHIKISTIVSSYIYEKEKTVWKNECTNLTHLVGRSLPTLILIWCPLPATTVFVLISLSSLLPTWKYANPKHHLCVILVLKTPPDWFASVNILRLLWSVYRVIAWTAKC